MPQLLSETRPKARKAYPCMACEWIDHDGDANDHFTLEESEAWKRAKANGMKILPGETYVRQAVKDGDAIGTFRAIPEIHDICLRYDYYQE